MTHWIENIANELSKMDVEEHVIAYILETLATYL